MNVCECKQTCMQFVLGREHETESHTNATPQCGIVCVCVCVFESEEGLGTDAVVGDKPH